MFDVSKNKLQYLRERRNWIEEVSRPFWDGNNWVEKKGSYKINFADDLLSSATDHPMSNKSIPMKGTKRSVKKTRKFDIDKRLKLTSPFNFINLLSWAHFGYYQKCERAVSELRQSNGNDKINNSIEWRTAEKKLFSLNSSTLDSCFIPQSSASRICKSSPLKSQNCRRISECLPLKRCATEPTHTSRSPYIWSPRDKISNFDGWQRELELGREWFSKSRSQNHPESMRQWQQRQIFNLCAPKRAETFDTDFISRQISTLSLSCSKPKNQNIHRFCSKMQTKDIFWRDWRKNHVSSSSLHSSRERSDNIIISAQASPHIHFLCSIELQVESWEYLNSISRCWERIWRATDRGLLQFRRKLIK